VGNVHEVDYLVDIISINTQVLLCHVTHLFFHTFPSKQLLFMATTLLRNEFLSRTDLGDFNNVLSVNDKIGEVLMTLQEIANF